MKKCILFCLWMALLCTSSAFADSGELVRMQRAIDLRVDSGQFMGAVLISRDGEVLLNRAYGFASVAQKISNQTDTRFRVGSVTKQFTAASILLLEQRGKLKLDDPIKKYMPDAPEEWSRITFRHLLSHTSGIPNITSQRDYHALEGTAVTPRQLVERLRDRRLDFRPGSSFNYSNSGYLLLGYLIEKISGESYGRFLQRHFFRPLKMWNSGYDPNAGRLPRQAQGHVVGKDGLITARFIDMSAPFSSSGIYSTTGDLLRWLRALYGGKVLHAAQLQQMLTPSNNHYGMGVMVEQGPGGSPVYSIGGGVEGFNTQVVYVPRGKLAVIVLSNVAGEAVNGLASDLRKVAAGEPVTLQSDRVPVNLTADELDRLAGYYWSEEATILSVTHKDDHLLMVGAGGARHLYPQSRHDFFAQKEDVELSFTDDDQGRSQSLVIHLPERSVYAERISANDVRAICDIRARKIQQQTPTPGSDAALRTLIEEIVAGTPDYSRLGPAAGDLTRRELPHLQSVLASMGVIKQIDFLGVAPVTAADVYVVTFTHGTIQARISLGPDGKIWSQEMRSGQGSPPVRPAPQKIAASEHGRRY